MPPTVSPTIRSLERTAPPLAAQLASRRWLSPRRQRKVDGQERFVMDLATTSDLRLGSRRIAVYSWGTGPKPVLLVHGWQGRASEFTQVVRELRSPERTVIAFDAPGHGASGGRRADLNEVADIIRMLEARFGTFEAVTGHSWGSPAAALAIRGGVNAKRFASIGGVAEAAYLPQNFASTLKLGDETARALKARIERRLFPGVPHLWSSVADAGIPVLVVRDAGDSLVELDQSLAQAVSRNATATSLTTTGLDHNHILRDDAVLDAIAAFVDAPVPVPVDARATRVPADTRIPAHSSR